jgi:site-specific DNA-cytosine methylase
MDITKTTTHLGLCAGYGGIEIGLKRVIPDLRTVALCEIEAYACANLVAKMEAGLMDAAPIWTNLKTFPWAEFRDRVDILTGGYPCQPFSAAGKRLGTEDPRHLWPYIADGIAAMRPSVCFFENVEGHISLGLPDVIEDLGRLGYRTTWGIFSASEVGATHQRKRVFILAYRNGKRFKGAISKGLQRPSREPFGYYDDDLANSDNGRSGKDKLLPELRTAWVKQSPRSSWVSSESSQEREVTQGSELAYLRGEGLQGAEWIRQAGEKRQPSGYVTECGCTAWPSRPGQPQHGWEPPRVVTKLAESESVRCSGLAPKCGSVSKGSISEVDQPNEGHTSKSIRCGATNEPSRVVGNATSPRCPRPENTGADCGDEGQRAWREESQRAGLLGNSNSPRPQERQGQRGQAIQGTDADGGEDAERQTQPALGGDLDGPASGMDYAELCVSTDNRTDELRLLGNGVVPATAELAFRTLFAELTPTQPEKTGQECPAVFLHSSPSSSSSTSQSALA